MTDVTFRRDPPREVAALPHRGPFKNIGNTFALLGPWLDAAGVALAGPAVAACHDMPGATPDEDLRSHAGVEVAAGTRLPASLDQVALPGGPMAVLLQRGPYEGIAAAWDAAYRWLGTSDLGEADQPPYEPYLNDPDGARPEDLPTEICIPLREGAET